MCPSGPDYQYPDDCTHTICSVAHPNRPCGRCGECYPIPEPTGCPCGIVNEGTCYARCATDCVSRKEPDFKIAITEQTECISDTVGPTSSECANDPSYCTSWPECQTGCAYRSTVSLDRVSQCDISFDAGNQAENLKGLGVELYTVYFDTQGIPEIAERMCDWSSEEVADCPRGGTYAFSGIEIEEVIDQALGSIIIKPNNILIGGLTLSDPDPYASETFIEDWSIDILLSCGSSITDLPVTYSSEGEIIVSDLLYYYCPNKGAYINGSN